MKKKINYQVLLTLHKTGCIFVRDNTVVTPEPGGFLRFPGGVTVTSDTTEFWLESEGDKPTTLTVGQDKRYTVYIPSPSLELLALLFPST